MSTPAWYPQAHRLAAVLETIGARELERHRLAPASSRTIALFKPCDPDAIPGLWEVALEDVRSDPAAFVDRRRVREVGWQLYALGGLDAMRGCADMIESGATLSYVDAAWEGIGPPGGALWCH